MIEVEMPDGKILAFPDNTPEEEIQRRADAYYYGPRLTPEGTVPGKSDRGYTVTDMFSDAANNFVDSGVQAAMDTAQPILHPLDTATALGKTALGYAQKLPFVPGTQFVPNADAMNDYFAERYGSGENAMRTFGADPVGVLADVSTVATGVGGALRGGAAGTRALAKQTAKGTGKAAARTTAALSKASEIMAGRPYQVVRGVADYVDPIGAATQGLALATNAAVGRDFPLPNKLYQSVLKPSVQTIDPQKVRDMVDAGVKNRIPLTMGGLKKANGLIEQYNSQIDKLVADADAAGKTIDLGAVAADALRSPQREQYVMDATPQNMKIYDRTVDQFSEHHGPYETTVSAAQEMKKATGKNLQQHRAWNPNVAQNPAQIAAKKEIAASLRQRIANIDPRIDAINKLEGPMIGLRDQLENALNRTGNNNPLSLTPAIIGAGFGGGAGAGVGVLGSLASAPGIKSRAAFALDEAMHHGNPFRGLLGLLYGSGQTMYTSQEAGRNADK